jgi:hypothetical protein
MAYPAPKWAEKIARAYNQTRRRRVRWYSCPECGWWHIGRGRVRIIKRKEKVKDYGEQ